MKEEGGKDYCGLPSEHKHTTKLVFCPPNAEVCSRANMNHFEIFGSSVYFHVTKDAQKKLDPIAELGILVGYTDTPHNYRVFLLTSQRIVVHRDLKFDEQKSMRVLLETELNLHAEGELSVPKEEEPETDA